MKIREALGEPNNCQLGDSRVDTFPAEESAIELVNRNLNDLVVETDNLKQNESLRTDLYRGAIAVAEPEPATIC